MTEASAEPIELPPEEPPRARRWPRWLLMFGGLLLLVLGALWLAREEIADRIVQRQLKDMGLPATYEIEKVGPDTQILRNVVIGDPKHPDFTAELVEVSGNPGNLRPVNPRLYGTNKAGKANYGPRRPARPEKIRPHHVRTMGFCPA